MKIFVYLGHPAQYHFFKNISAGLRKGNITVTFIIKKKDVLEELLINDNGKFLNILAEQLFENVKLYTSDVSKLLVSVTSGFDGRTNIAMLRTDNFDYLTFSYGMRGSRQITVPQSISKKLNIPYKPIYCDKIDFLSKGIVADLKKVMGAIPVDKISITPNSFIDYHNYYPQYPKDNAVVFMSRLTAIKNPMLFLEAISLLSKRNRSFSTIEFYILGDGPLVKEIVDFIRANDLPNVHFEGMIYEPWKYLQKSKIFISIQSENNYPSQSLLEAMACENAIIASDVGETRLLVTENEGILVKLNAEAIADAIDKLFTTSGLIEKLGKNARQKVLKEHTIEKFAEYFYLITKG